VTPAGEIARYSLLDISDRETYVIIKAGRRIEYKRTEKSVPKNLMSPFSTEETD